LPKRRSVKLAQIVDIELHRQGYPVSSLANLTASRGISSFLTLSRCHRLSAPLRSRVAIDLREPEPIRMPKLEIEQFACLSDNYAVLIHDPDAGVTTSIDAPDAKAILARLKAKGWTLTHLLNTHHHSDHTGGNLQLKQETGCTIIGPRGEAERIPGIDQEVGEGDVVAFGDFEIKVLETPGHTLGHVSYFIPAAKIAFAGDTLFAMGAGRIFEGNAEMMWKSLQKIMKLPPDTEIYCGHEYTQSNARFALTLEPNNLALVNRAKEVDRLRDENKPTLPTRLDRELETNPFLRPHVTAIRAKLGMLYAPDWHVFAAIRERKNKS
jgi:hydroxyacylglutathione hydrolase